MPTKTATRSLPPLRLVALILLAGLVAVVLVVSYGATHAFAREYGVSGSDLWAAGAYGLVPGAVVGGLAVLAVRIMRPGRRWLPFVLGVVVGVLATGSGAVIGGYAHDQDLARADGACSAQDRDVLNALPMQQFSDGPFGERDGSCSKVFTYAGRDGAAARNQADSALRSQGWAAESGDTAVYRRNGVTLHVTSETDSKATSLRVFLR
ncbi:hypothetical protein [Streptomyces sp. NPDC057909]|uniref:hypothetical protein n=1 Tax=Streptomyces sp. NPDC057909 TaxID=3346277 RepID=UPI0036EC3C77